MSENRPSSTAMGAALLRAAHWLLDEEPKVLNDSLAAKLIGIEGDLALKMAFGKLQEEFAQRAGAELGPVMVRYLRASIVLRNRYAEDLLEEAVARGIGQYVILGAGLDSFAYRRPGFADRLQVFEVDLPATQDWKRNRIGELGIAPPSSLSFVPTDFERQPLMEVLQAGGYRADQPAFFCWLGVTGYLTEAAIFKTLGEVSAAAPGSEIVFTYGLKESLVDERGRKAQAALKAGIAARNEPSANSGFDPVDLAERVKATGFAQVWDLDSATANARYFSNRGDGLCVSSMTHLMRARIGGSH